MKTLDQFFASLFFALGVIALIGVATGATHQIALAIVCGIMTAAFSTENITQERRIKARHRRIKASKASHV